MSSDGGRSEAPRGLGGMSDRVLPPHPAQTLDWQGLLACLLPLIGQQCSARVYCGSPLQVVAVVLGTFEHSSDLGEGCEATLILHLSGQLLVIEWELFVGAVRSEEPPPRGGAASVVLTIALEGGLRVELEHDIGALG